MPCWSILLTNFDLPAKGKQICQRGPKRRGVRVPRNFVKVAWTGLLYLLCLQALQTKLKRMNRRNSNILWAVLRFSGEFMAVWLLHRNLTLCLVLQGLPNKPVRKCKVKLSNNFMIKKKSILKISKFFFLSGLIVHHLIP